MVTYKQVKLISGIKEVNEFCYENEEIVSVTPVQSNLINQEGLDMKFLVVYNVHVKAQWARK